MKRNKYGAIELESLGESVKAVLLAALTELQFIREVPLSDENDMVWNVEPDRNDWIGAGWLVQKYHFYDFVLGDDVEPVKRLLLLDHYYDGSHRNPKKHVTHRNYLTFNKESSGWTCMHWQSANAAAITRMSKTQLANDPGYLIQLVEFKAVKRLLSDVA